MGARLAWLGLTPEPERELPLAVAMLRARAAGDTDATPWIDAEAARINHQIMHGTSRTWLRYLDEVTTLITAAIPPLTASATFVKLRGPEGPEAATSVKLRGPGGSEGTTSVKLRGDDDLGLVLRAAEAVLDHHRMLIGLPGSGYERAAADRVALSEIVGRLQESLR